MRRSLTLPIVLLIIITFAIFANSLLNGFVYDDIPQVLENLWITDPSYIPDIFSSSAWSFFDPDLSYNYYRPMMHIIYMGEYFLFTLEPFGWHLVNLLIHILNAVLVFLISDQLLFAPPSESGASTYESRRRFPVFPFLCALVFALHPVTTEVVAWVAAIPELSYTAFFLLSLYFYIIAQRATRESAGGISNKAFYIFSVLFYLVSLFCKEPAILLPVLLFAYDISRRRKVFSYLFIIKMIPYALCAGLYIYIRSVVLGGLGTKFSEHDYLSAFQNILNIGPLVFNYFYNLIAPMRFSPFYIFHPVLSPLQIRALLSWAFIALAIVVIIYLIRKRRETLTPLTILILPLMPVLYIPALRSSVFSVRYLYLPLAGFAMLTVLLISHLLQRTRTLQGRMRLSKVVTVIVIALLTMTSYKVIYRNALWRDDISLWRETSLLYPGNYLAHYNLALAYGKAGNYDGAVLSYLASIKASKALDRPAKLIIAQSWYNLGLLSYDRGERRKSIEYYEKALEFAVKPAFTRDVLNNLGNAYAESALYAQAIESYNRAITIDPTDSYLRHNLEAVRRLQKGSR